MHYGLSTLWATLYNLLVRELATLIFWAFGPGFEFTIGNGSAGVLGLSPAYGLKYRLDKHFAFYAGELS